MLFPLHIGMDLGTTRVLISTKSGGVVLDEPAVVAFYRNEGKIIAVGSKAVDMMGKTPAHIQTVRPLRHGVIVNLPMAEAMLRNFLRRIGLFYRPRVTISVPANVTNVARRAVREAALAAGAHKVWLLEGPIAAAYGAELNMRTPTGIMVIDIGGGTTDIAVISNGQSIISDSVSVAGDQFNSAIQDLLHYQYNLLISDHLAEEIKIALGTAVNPTELREMEVRGSDVVNGVPRSQIIKNTHIFEALQEPLQSILDAIKKVLSHTPPALAGDLVTQGIVLTGGGSLLNELPEFLQEKLHIPVRVAPNAQQCVALGTLKADTELLDSMR